MDKIYRLEFNESQQNFHMDDNRAKENTFGWFTVMDNCTDLEFYIFESYVNRVKQKRLTKHYLIKCVTEVAGFMSNLREYNLNITR